MNENLVKAKLSIDNNHFYLDPLKPTIAPFEIEYFNLEVGDKIMGYEDDQEWEGIVGYDSSYPEEMEWFLYISNGVKTTVSPERMEGRSEGSRATMPYGEIRGKLIVAEALLTEGVDIELVIKYTKLSKRRLEKIVKRIML